MTPEELDELREKHFGGDTEDDEEDDVEEFERSRLRFLHGTVPWWDWEA
ncbi:hypothetical protein [Halolamina salifodinae]|uniref:Uncharacterized protein n=1 Tax=Halolamina salifodinae TaxID=1202767 RepID=A0A8T4GZI0_9EURY|nr:hypothetical protein [Halolamina salifodinae]MBP1986775.1 hypothetical protein [Halolamina salifodinae]